MDKNTAAQTLIDAAELVHSDEVRAAMEIGAAALRIVSGIESERDHLRARVAELEAESETLKHHLEKSEATALELADRLECAQWPQTAEPVEYDEDLHDAWQYRLVELVKQYRDAEAGHEVRDAFRAITAHINVLPMGMAMLPAEARAGLTIQANEIDRLRAHIADLDDQLGDMRRDLNDARSAQQPAQDVARDALERIAIYPLGRGDEISAHGYRKIAREALTALAASKGDKA